LKEALQLLIKKNSTTNIIIETNVTVIDKQILQWI